MKITQAQRDLVTERRRIDEELRKAIEEDEVFQKQPEQEKRHQLIRAMLLTGHNLTGL